jgi:hypothetical protein
MKCFEEHKILSLYAWIIFFLSKENENSVGMEKPAHCRHAFIFSHHRPVFETEGLAPGLGSRLSGSGV